MSTETIAGNEVKLDDEGFLVDAGQWTREIGAAIAADNGIPEMTDRHWQVIKFMRQEYFEKGTGPTVRLLGKASGDKV